MKKILVGLLVLISASATAQYTPMFAKGYQFKYLKADSGFVVPVRDTTFVSGITKLGSMVIRPADSILYIYTNKWKAVVSDSAGFQALLNLKVDSVKIYSDTLWNYYSGVGVGQLFTVSSLFPSGHTFDITTGIFSTQRNGTTDISVDLDGRYSFLTHSHAGLNPIGGTTGQVLKKNSNTDYDYSWQAPDAGYVTTSQLDDTAAAIRADFPTGGGGGGGSFDTTTIYANLALKKNITDSVLATGYATNYDVKKSKDSVVALIPSITGKLNIADTASMLTPYFREVGFSLSKSGHTVSFDSTTGFHTQPYNDIRYLQTASVAQGNVILSGGQVTWISGLDYYVSPTTYIINSIQYSFTGGVVTLAAADPSLDRQDAIILTSSQTATSITGVPDANPLVPTEDPATQIFLTSGYIAAAATTPSNISQEIIRDEGAGGEATITKTLTSTDNYGTNPYHGSISQRITAASNNQYVQWTKASGTWSKSAWTNLVFYIRNNSAFNSNRNWILQLFNGNTQIGNSFNLSGYGYIKTTTGSYQTIAVPLNIFSGTDLFDAVKLINSGTGGTVDVQIDYIQLQGGVSNGSTGNGTLTNITATNNYGQTWTITNPTTNPNLSLQLDTTKFSTRLWRQKGIDSVTNLLSGYVPSARTITTNAPLTGGGALSSNLTLSADTSAGSPHLATQYFVNSRPISTFTNDAGYTTNTGTVTSFGKTDGYGITSSVANATTTPNHTIAVDTSLISSRLWRQKGVDSLSTLIATKLAITDTTGKWVSNVKRSNDSVFILKNSTWTFVYKDSTGSGSASTLQQVFNTQVGGSVLTKSDTVLSDATNQIVFDDRIRTGAVLPKPGATNFVTLGDFDGVSGGSKIVVGGNAYSGTIWGNYTLYGALKFDGPSGGSVNMHAIETGDDWDFQLPANNGTPGQVLTTDGDGVTSWTTVSGGSGDMVLASIQTVTGAKTFNSGKLILAGATSGTTTLNANAVAGTGTVTLPTTGTLSTLAGSEALTNKDLTGAGNTFPTFNQNTTGTASKFTGMTFAEVNTAVTDADLARTSGTNTFTGVQTMATPDFTTGFTIGTAAANGKFIVGNGTNYVPSTSTIPTSASTTGKILISDGTNYVNSTPTFPNSAGTTGNVLTSDGTNFTSSANNGGWTTVRVSGSAATNTGTALATITGLTTGTLTNSTKYEIDADIDANVSAVTTGITYGITAGGSGSAAVVNVLVTGTTTTNAGAFYTLAAPDVATSAFVTSSGANGMIHLHGFVTTRSTGTATIAIQHAKPTSGTATAQIGSVFRYRIAQ